MATKPALVRLRRYLPASWKGWSLLAALALMTGNLVWYAIRITQRAMNHPAVLVPVLWAVLTAAVVSWAVGRSVDYQRKVDRLERRVSDLEARGRLLRDALRTGSRSMD